MFQLNPVEYLLGSSSKLGEIIVLGMLTQMKEVNKLSPHFSLLFPFTQFVHAVLSVNVFPQGKWYLEDPTGAVQLDLTRAISFK